VLPGAIFAEENLAFVLGVPNSLQDMRDTTSSPTLSCSSADEALYELLGVDKLSLEQEDECNVQPQPQNTVSYLTPPASCQRPHTPHDSLLLLCPQALSSWQCQYIIKKGYQATNDGGAHYGPRYVKEAAQSHGSASDDAVVKLQKPNHHKVCVFMDNMILTWLECVIQKQFDEYIREWNISENKQYMVNPRLRLLRYDAADEDVFLSHYDATTTTTLKGVEYESKLTILLYLNADFCDGETAFLNSLNPSDFLNITPTTGQVVVFNHELYHASRELQYNGDFVVDGIEGGTKFVLRSDVLFEKEAEEDLCTSTSLLEMPTSDVVEVKVADILSGMNDNDNDDLTKILDELDFLNVSVNSFLVPGRCNLIRMLADLGARREECDVFLASCEASLE